MSGHTKGPWRVEEGTTLVWGACNPDDLTNYGMGYPVAECRITPISSWAKGPDSDEGEANARLIAAAPDMINELRQCAVELEEAANVLRPTLPSLSSIYASAAKRTIALIAKAEGRS